VRGKSDPSDAFEGFTPIIEPGASSEVTCDGLWKEQFRDSVTFSVLAMDSAYYAYSVTQQNSSFFDPLSDISFPTRGPAAWNIQGDGIGMFVGRIIARTRTIIPISAQP
jgi:hypothetical protein